MGQKISRPPPAPVRFNAPRPAPPTPPAPPLNPALQCNLRKARLNEVNADVRNLQAQVDSCDPAQAQARKTQQAIEDARKYARDARTNATSTYNEITKQVNYAKALDAGMKPANLYIKELEREKAKLGSMDKKFEQFERKQRRDFLDNDPQGGVSGIPGFQTSDDKAMLAFYICFGVFIFLVITGTVSFFRAQLGDAKTQANIVLVAWVASMGLAYYGIAVYG